MPQIDDITLMAYADGELPDQEAARVEAAIQRRPGLARALASVSSHTRRA